MNKNVLLIGAVALIAIAGVAYLAMQAPALAPTTDQTPVVTNTNGTVQQNPPAGVPAGDVIVDNSPTPGKPIPTTNATVAPTDTTAVVTGTVNPQGAITTYWYEYGTTRDLGKKTSNQVVGSGYTAIATPGYITGLTKNTIYYFRLVAENQYGRVAADQNVLTTSANSSTPVGGIPKVSTLAATGITSTAANLKGTVNPNKASTKYWFEIGKDGTLGGVTALVEVGDGSDTVQASASATNLEPGTTYYYRINAQNQFGTVNGAILTFKTGGKLIQPVPVVTTQVAGSIGTTTATVYGTVNPYGLQTSYWFEYGTDSSFDKATKTQKKSAGAVTTTVSVQATLTGLKAKTTYYVRVVAQNPGGTVEGDSQSFQTK